MAVTWVRIWGTAAGLAAASAVVAGYLIDGPGLVLAVAVVEALLVMVHVAWRFRARVGTRAVSHASGAAPCERCRRAHERLDGQGVAR
jgi:hypothetical protein